MIVHSCLIEHVLYNSTAAITTTTTTATTVKAIMVITTVHSDGKIALVSYNNYSNKPFGFINYYKLSGRVAHRGRVL